jgi:monoamine oxidase
MKRPDTIIIGAGAAGLATAAALAKAGRSVLVLEGRSRIGGRIYTVCDPAFQMPVELGAEFVHGQPEATWKLIRAAELVAQDVPFESWERRNGQLVHATDFSRKMTKIMGGLSRIGRRDMSFAQYLRQRCRGPKLAHARRLATMFVEGFDAADTELISAHALAKEQEGLGDLDEEPQFRLRDGYGALVEYLRSRLEGPAVTIRLGQVVTDVNWRRGKVDVVCKTHSGMRKYRAPRVIVTLPVGIVQLEPRAKGAVRFMPDLPQKRQAALKLGSGPVVKVICKFKEPFWESASTVKSARSAKELKDAGFFHDPDAAFPTWWTALPLRLSVLTGWSGGPNADALSGRGRTAIMDEAVKSLAHIFGMRRAALSRLLEHAHLHDWPADPLARGAYSYEMVGSRGARARLAKPVEDTLFFAGEATDTSGQASTVAGALASGERAAREVLNSMPSK